MGELFAEAGLHLIFGGGKSGLMGRMADSLLQQGGEAIGVIPGFMCDEGWQHDGLTELKVVETMNTSHLGENTFADNRFVGRDADAGVCFDDFADGVYFVFL